MSQSQGSPVYQLQSKEVAIPRTPCYISMGWHQDYSYKFRRDPASRGAWFRVSHLSGNAVLRPHSCLRQRSHLCLCQINSPPASKDALCRINELSIKATCLSPLKDRGLEGERSGFCPESHPLALLPPALLWQQDLICSHLGIMYTGPRSFSFSVFQSTKEQGSLFC